MKLVAGMKSIAQNVINGDVRRGTVHTIDFDRISVVMENSTTIIRNVEVVGDPEKLKPGDVVTIVIVKRKAVALTSDAAQLITETIPHAEIHSKDGIDPITPESIGAAAVDHKHSNLSVDAIADVGSLRSLGVGQLQAAPGNHNHTGLMPGLHASTHLAAGSDPITWSSVLHSSLSGTGTNTHTQLDTALTRLANTSGTNTGDQVVPVNTSATANQFFTAYSAGTFTKARPTWADVDKTISSLADLTTKVHSALTGLASDDHAQYLNTTRHDVTARHTLGTVVPHDALSALSDVTITTPATTQLLQYNGADWVNVALSTIDHGALGGQSDDDHTQYLNTTRHDVTARHTLGTVVPHDAHSALSGLTVGDDHTQYLNTTRHDVTARHTLGTVVPHDALSALSDVTITTLASGNLIQYNGIDWVNVTLASIDHGSFGGQGDDDHAQYLNNARHDLTARHTLGTVVPHDALSALTDVTITTPSSTHLLQYNGTDWVNVTLASIDHGALGGQGDDDHAQYLNTTRHDTTTRHTLGTVVPHDAHSALTGLTSGDDHTQYLNTTRHDATARHTLGTVVPHDAHSALSGLGNDDHTQYFLANGTRTLSGNLTITGNIVPNVTDVSDIGSSAKLVHKIWASELDAVLFAINTVQLYGGWLMIAKGEGSLNTAVATGTAAIDFGQAMTLNDIVLIRAALQEEYLKIGTLVSGTTYNVTRNLDGGTDIWTIGTPYAILGGTTGGRIELNAKDTPRLSIFKRTGALWNNNAEIARFGDLNGLGGIATEQYGVFIGDASDYLKYDGTTLTVAGDGSGLTAISGGNITTGSITAAVVGTTELIANTANIKNGIITTAKIGALQVTTALIADANITTAKIANLAVTTALIADANITTAKIGLLQVTNAQIALATITDAQIASATITSAKIAALDAAKITSGYIDVARLNAGTVTGDKLSLTSYLAIGSATFGADGIQLDYNAANPRAYIGNGTTKYFKFDGTDISWKGINSELTAAGVFTASNATITGAITATSGDLGALTVSGKLSMSGASSAIAIGTTPPTSAIAGTGLWVDRTGYYGLNAGVAQVKISAVDGALVAGRVSLNSVGVSIAADVTGVNDASSYKFKSGATTTGGLFSYASSGTNAVTLQAQSIASKMGWLLLTAASPAGYESIASLSATSGTQSASIGINTISGNIQQITLDAGTVIATPGTINLYGTTVVSELLTAQKGIQASGTVFPASPTVGQMFFRSDLGILCYWNSIYWLSVNEYSVQLNRVASQAASGTLPAFAVREDYRPYFTRCVANISVATTNNGTNYWLVDARAINQGYSGSDSVATFSTAAILINTDTHFTYVPARVSTINPVARIDWYATKIGTPGVAAFEATVYYKLLIA